MDKMDNIHSIFFDIGGVILSNGWDTASRKKASEYFSLDFGEIESRHEKVVRKFELGHMNHQDYLNEVYFFRDRPFGREEFTDFMKARSIPREATIHVLQMLKETGNYKLSAINNESLLLNDFRIEKFQLYRYFENFFSSSFLHVRKPDPKIYETVLGITHSRPDECLYIDDREVNIAAAQQVGLHCIHLKNTENLSEELKVNQIKLSK